MLVSLARFMLCCKSKLHLSSVDGKSAVVVNFDKSKIKLLETTTSKSNIKYINISYLRLRSSTHSSLLLTSQGLS